MKALALAALAALERDSAAAAQSMARQTVPSCAVPAGWRHRQTVAAPVHRVFRIAWARTYLRHPDRRLRADRDSQMAVESPRTGTPSSSRGSIS